MFNPSITRLFLPPALPKSSLVLVHLRTITKPGFSARLTLVAYTTVSAVFLWRIMGLTMELHASPGTRYTAHHLRQLRPSVQRERPTPFPFY